MTAVDVVVPDHIPDDAATEWGKDAFAEIYSEALETEAARSAGDMLHAASPRVFCDDDHAGDLHLDVDYEVEWLTANRQ